MKNDKITIELSGGLGNQLFQYATARSYALRHNRRLVLDISNYNATYNRNCSILKFVLVDQVSTVRFSKVRRLYRRLHSKLYKLNELEIGKIQTIKVFLQFNFENIKEIQNITFKNEGLKKSKLKKYNKKLILFIKNNDYELRNEVRAEAIAILKENPNIDTGSAYLMAAIEWDVA